MELPLGPVNHDRTQGKRIAFVLLVSFFLMPVAWAQTQGQLAWYKTMEEAGLLTQIIDRESLGTQLSSWDSSDETKPIGYILSLEGADSIISMSHLERAYEQGLRAIGPAHYGLGIYAQGTNAAGGLSAKGRQLLEEMERLNIILDVVHLCDESFSEAMDLFGGTILGEPSQLQKPCPPQQTTQ